MNQSTYIAGFIFAAFLVFITMRGELRSYMGLLIGNAPAQKDAENATTKSVDVASAVSSIAKIAVVL